MSEGMADPFGPDISVSGSVSLLEPLPKERQVRLEFIQVTTSIAVSEKDGERRQVPLAPDPSKV